MADEENDSSKSPGMSLRQIGVWLILGLIVAVFGLSFGLPSGSLTFGAQPLARVHGTAIHDEDFTYQLNAISVVMKIPQDEKFQELMGLREEVLDAAVERLVVSEAAEDMGLATVQRDAELLTANGHLIVLGDTIDWLGERAFNYDVFKNNILPQLQVSEPKYLEFQRREVLARTARDLMAASVVVPESVLRAEYDEQANKLSLRYARFSNRSFAQLHDPSPEEIDGYVGAHSDELLAQFNSQGSRFTKLPKQVRLRFIKVDKPAAAGDDADAETKAAVATQTAQAKSRIKGLASRIDGGEDFRAVAREASSDVATRRSGGDYGWVSVEGTGSGLDPVIDEAAKALDVNAVSDVLTGEDGFYLVRVDGRREGDVPETDALRELAAEALAKEHGRALAKQAASEAVLALKSGKTWADLFETPDALGATSPGIDALPMGGDDEVLPGAAPIEDKPSMRETGLFPKDASIPGIGAMPELTKAAWAADEKAEVIDQVFETEDGYLVAGIDKKDTGSDEGFAEQREDLFRQLTDEKYRRISPKWAQRRCTEARARGEIVPNDGKIASLMVYDTPETEEGDPGLRPYTMCDRVGNRGGMLRTAALMGGGG